MPTLHTFWIPVTFSIGAPQSQPGPATATTQWVKVDVPLSEPDTVTGAAPFIEVPASIPAKQACEVRINGQARKVAACVARVLAQVASGAKVVRMRMDAQKKLAAQVPEVRLSRDFGVKIIGKRAVWLVA